MKKVCFIIGALFTATCCMATNNVNEVATATEQAQNCLSFKDKLLSFCKNSKLVISDKNGHVIFYNEQVQELDFSEWEKGSYVAQVNDKETFEFSL